MKFMGRMSLNLDGLRGFSSEGTLCNEILIRSKIYLRTLRYSVFTLFDLTSLFNTFCSVSTLTGKSHSLVLSPGHISFCFYCEGDIPVSLLPFRFEVFCAFVVCAPQLHPFVSFAGCVVFGIRPSTLKHDGILVNQRTSQSLHVGVKNGSNNFMWFLLGSTEACACMRFLPAPF